MGGRVEPGHDVGGAASSTLLQKGTNCVLAGLDPAIHVLHPSNMGGYVYVMTNKPNGTLYTGVTSDLSRRVWEHREGTHKGFTKRYGLKRLVWFTYFEDIRDAIQHEKNMKHWSRAWKVQAIHRMNLSWDDLYETLM